MINTDIIKQFEGCKLKAYLCPANKWTIGYGSTRHPNGVAVKKGDTITQQQAEDYLQTEVSRRLTAMALPSSLSPNQQAALVSFQYNVGMSAWANSTLKKKVIANAQDPAIATEFAKWNKVNGVAVRGLTRRRAAEAELYFKE